MQSWLLDLKSGIRILTRSPGLAAVAVFVLALGIGLTSTIGSIVNGMILQGLPFEEGDRILHLETQIASRGGEPQASFVRDFLDWRDQQSSFESLVAWTPASIYISDREDAQRFVGARISADAFAQLRITPLLGRLFQAEDDTPGAPAVVLLAHHVWRNRYAGDPGIVGQKIRVNNVPTTVVGVMPERFRFPIRQDIWIPLQPDPRTPRGQEATLYVFGRLRDGLSLKAAQGEMNVIAERLEEAHPDTNTGFRVVVKPYLLQVVNETHRTLGFTALAVSFFVLLIGCSNVANLLLAQTIKRSKELAMRSALGARRGRIIRQILSESLCLAMISAPLGLGLAALGVKRFNAAVAGQQWPYWFDVRVDAAVLLFAFFLALAATLASGLMPALRASRVDVNAILKDESQTGSQRIGRLGRGLMIGQIALSCGLLIGGGLMLRSIVELAQVDFRFTPEGLFTGRMGLTASTYPGDPERIQFYENLREGLEELPDVSRAALANYLPTDFHSMAQYRNAERSDSEDEILPRARWATITTGFFAVLGVELLEGRDFDSRDREHSEPVVIVNQSLAEREWPGESPIGKRVRLGRSTPLWRTVIGLVPDLYMGGVVERQPAGLYLPLAQDSRLHMGILIRPISGAGSRDPLALTDDVRARVRAMDQGLPVYSVRTMQSKIQQENFFYRLVAIIFSIAGALALVLAISGIYGIMAFVVNQRIVELGLRMGLGATRWDIFRLIQSDLLRQLLWGLLIGFLLGAALGRLLSSQLFGIGVLDLPTYCLVAGIVLAAGILASLHPSWRAVRVQPAEALLRRR